MTMATVDSYLSDPQPSSQTRSVRHGVAAMGGRIVGQSPSMDEITRTVTNVAQTREPVLLVGAPGTGKSFFARTIHEITSLGSKPFVVLAEGAPADQESLRRCIEAAASGTLFVQAIDLLDSTLQAELAALAAKNGEGDSPRLIASSEKPLEESACDANLCAQLSARKILLPTMLERVEDIRLFVKHFFDLAAARARRADLRGVSPEAMAILETHPFAENLRGLERVIDHVVATAEGPYATVADLPEELRAPKSEPTPLLLGSLPAQGIDLRGAVEEFETRMILQALERTGWNKNRASRLLGLNRTTLVEMIKRKRLVPPAGLRRPASAGKSPTQLQDDDALDHAAE